MTAAPIDCIRAALLPPPPLATLALMAAWSRSSAATYQGTYFPYRWFAACGSVAAGLFIHICSALVTAQHTSLHLLWQRSLASALYPCAVQLAPAARLLLVVLMSRIAERSINSVFFDCCAEICQSAWRQNARI